MLGSWLVRREKVPFAVLLKKLKRKKRKKRRTKRKTKKSSCLQTDPLPWLRGRKRRRTSPKTVLWFSLQNSWVFAGFVAHSTPL
jgi:hypothetical protein